MPYLILGIALVLGLILILRGLANADVRRLAQALRSAGIGIGVALVGFLVATGRLGLLLPLLPLLVPFFLRWRDVRNRFKAARGPSQGRVSKVETATLTMWLDHDTGQTDGEVRSGRFAGRRLGDLSKEEQLSLLADCRRQDAQGAVLLESWLDRIHGPDWREAAAGHRGGSGSESHAGPAGGDDGPMTRQQAFAILGLEPGASPESVRNAHKRLMLKFHPDLGGSTYLAARINQARDILLDD